jgi:hypothetical protein
MSGWKPLTYPSISPYLICREPERVIDFMIAVFELLWLVALIDQTAR